jgi:hypothetical protein
MFSLKILLFTVGNKSACFFETLANSKDCSGSPSLSLVDFLFVIGREGFSQLFSPVLLEGFSQLL